jgi:LPS export ABC transporter protein LptC
MSFTNRFTHIPENGIVRADFMANSLFVRRLLGLFVLLGALALLVVVFRYFNRSNHKKQVTLPAASVDLALKNLHFTESGDGQQVWELFAAEGDYNRAADLSTLKDLRFIVLKAKNGPVTVTARRGEYLHAAKKVTLIDDVVARGKDGMTFATTRITYDTGRRTFATVAPVRLTDGRLTVEGVGMDLDVDKQQAHVRGQVSTTILPGKSTK